MGPITHHTLGYPLPDFGAGLLPCAPLNGQVTVPNSPHTRQRLSPDFTTQGSHYDPKTRETTFLVAVTPKAHAVELVVKDPLAERVTIIPLETHHEGPRTFGACVTHIQPGTHYAYRLKDSNGEVLSPHCADPWALAETKASWKPEYVDQVRSLMRSMRRSGESDDSLIRRVYSEDRQEFLSKLGGKPTLSQLSPPWSIVIDRTQLMSPGVTQPEQPHAMGSRVICKYHPLHSCGVSAEFISPEFQHHRGKIDILLDPTFRSYLKRYWNTIEFFPLNPCLTSPELTAMGRTNAWGYMPTQLFALNPDYFSSPEPHEQIRTLQQVVKALKDDGISVITDLVPFHTAEAGSSAHFGLRALDENRYYLRNSDGTDIDISGCQNALNTNNPDVQKLLLDQSNYFIHTFGFDRRIDQAALAHTPAHDPYGFDPEHPFARELFELGPCIVELALPGNRFYFRRGASLRRSDGVYSKEFVHRNYQDYEASGALRDPWGHRMVGLRAFLQAGSVGGPHTIQQNDPLNQNKGVSVLPHDGLSNFDRAEIGAAILTAKRCGDPELLEIADQIRNTPSSEQFRYVLMGRLLEALREKHPEQLFDFRSAIAKRSLARHYLLPGAILSVFADQVCRTQNGNPDAYDREDLLTNAALPAANNPVLARAQAETALLIRTLFTLRNRYTFYFNNINIFDGKSPSSSDNSLIPLLSWHTTTGSHLEQRHWDKGVGSVRGFLGIQISAEIAPGASREAPPQLYIADSYLPRSIVLPALPEGRSWRLLINSCDPIKESGEPDLLAAGHTFRFDMPGIAVFESC